MANNLIQIKRTSISGRVANTVTLPNAGELALNMTDGIMYSTNGSVVFTIGANTVNSRVTNLLTTNTITTSTLISVGNNTVNTEITAGVIRLNGSELYIGNSTVITGTSVAVGNVEITEQAVLINGLFALTSQSAGIADNATALGGVSANQYITVSNNYTITGDHTYLGNVSISKLLAGGSLGNSGEVLVANSTGGVFWSSVIGYTGSKGDTGSLGYSGSAGFVGSTGAGFTGSKGDNSSANAISQSFTANGTQSSFTLDTSVNSQNNIIVSVDGLIQTPVTHYIIDGTTLLFTSAPVSNSNIEARNFELGTGAVGFTGSGGTGFTGSVGAGFTGSIGSLGFTGSKGDDGVIGGDGYTGSIGFTGSAGAGYTGSKGSDGFQGSEGYTGSIGFVGSSGAGFTGSKGENSSANAISESFTANGTQLTFTLNTSVNSQNNIIVSVDGLVQAPVTHYSITGTTLTFTNAPVSNSIVEARNFELGTGATGFAGSLGFTGSTGAGFTGSTGETGYVGSKGADGVLGGDGYTGSSGFTGSTGIGFTGSTGIGYTGSTGETGYVGSKGPAGTFGGAAFQYAFDSNTSDPTVGANGYIRLSNTTLTGANTLYISYVDYLNANVQPFLQTIDDSTSTIKGHFSIADLANNSNYILYAITGNHIEDSNHFNLPISYLSGSASFTNNTNVVITFARTGDIGDTGFQGSVGFVGSKGDLGFTGSIGIGYAGSIGDVGYTGSKGNDGVLGGDGYTGSIGFTGSTGAGYTGSKGDNTTANAISQSFTANGTQLTFTLDTSVNSQNNIIVSVDGLVQTPVTHYTITGTTLTFTSTPVSNSIVEARNFELGTGVVGYTGSGGLGYTGSKGDAGISGFTGSIGELGYTGSKGSDGVLGNDGYTGSIGFTGSGGAGFTGSKGENSSANAISQSFTANGTQLTFTLDTSVNSQNNIIVSVDGLVQTPVIHYTISGTTLTFTSSPVSNSIVEARNFEIGTGAVGFTGSGGNGFTGSAGAGFTGSIGELGFTGSRGIDGVLGGDGYTGSIGFTGSVGIGYAGSIGFTGSNGSNGFTGSTGIGYNGSIGFTGSEGVSGGIQYNVTNSDSGAYLIEGSSNPTLTLVKGFTYYFIINAYGHPFFIKTVSGTGTGNQFNTGVTNNGADVGTITFTVPFSAPSTLYYNCQYHGSMAGTFNIVDSVQGLIGYVGSTGYTGSQGDIGFAGSIGSTGFVGSTGAGFTGSIGSLGFTGSKGEDGVLGGDGYTGSIGFTGSAGAGFTGSIGELGYTGSGGLGFTGSGGAGFTGSKGDSSSANAISESFTANGTQLTFTLDTSVNSQNNIIVSVDGLVQTPVTHYTISGTTLTFTSTPISNSIVEARNFEIGTGVVGYTGSGGTGFTGSSGSGFTGSIGELGFTGSRGADGTLGGDGYTGSIGFTGSGGAGFTGSKGDSSSANAISESFTANGTQLEFTLSTSVNSQNNIIVSVDGLVQTPVTHYTITGTTLTFTSSPVSNSIVEARNFEIGTGVVGYTGSGGIGFTGSTGAGFTGSRGADGTLGGDGYTGSIGFTGSTGAGFTGSEGIGFTGSKGDNTTANAISQSFTANGTQLTFTLDTSVNSQNNIIVSVDGLVQTPVTHYTISGTTLTFTSSPVSNSIVEARNFELGTGVVGYTGSGGTGFTGSTGAGFTGSVGELGFTGSIGYSGSNGDLGYTGSTGVGFTGSIGYSGSKGDLGYSGSTGVGYTGSIGGSPPRVNTATSTATLTWNSDTYDQYQLTAMAAGVTVSADSGTPSNGQKILFRFKDDGTARSISLTTGTSKSFRAIGTTLPNTTVISKTLYVGAIYNSADNRWDVIATAQEA